MGVSADFSYFKSVFGHKLTNNPGITELMDDLGAALTLQQGSMLMLGGGNPAHIPQMQELWRELMLRLLQDSPGEFDRVLADYDQPAGSPAFRDAVAAFLSRQYGWELTRDHVAVTPGGQAALFFLLNRFAGRTEAGSEGRILLPLVPEYMGYADQGVGELGLFDARRPVVERMDERTFKYRIDFDQLDVSSRHGAMLVSRPCNPTSNVLTDGEMEKLRTIAREQKVPLIVDNAYGLPFPGVMFTRATPVWDRDVILTFSLSKLGLPGMRTGIVVAREEIISEIRSMTAISCLANNNLGQALVRPLLESDRISELAANVVKPFYEERSRKALELAHRHLPKGVPWRVHASEGAFFLWFWFEGLPVSSRELYQILKERGVVTVSGHYFFFGLDTTDWDHSRECLRVSFTQPEAVLEEGFRILGQVVAEVYQDAGSAR